MGPNPVDPGVYHGKYKGGFTPERRAGVVVAVVGRGRGWGRGLWGP